MDCGTGRFGLSDRLGTRWKEYNVPAGVLAKAHSKSELEHKLGGNIWRLIILAERAGIDIKKSPSDFLTKTANLVG